MPDRTDGPHADLAGEMSLTASLEGHSGTVRFSEYADTTRSRGDSVNSHAPRARSAGSGERRSVRSGVEDRDETIAGNRSFLFLRGLCLLACFTSGCFAEFHEELTQGRKPEE